MPTSIITTDDLREFKMELLDDIKQLLTRQASGKLKKYLKSSEVMDLLQVSPGTLQNLRINGTLPYTINGAWAFQQLTDQLGDDLGVSLLPSYQGKKMVPYFSSHVLAFPNNSLTSSKSKELTALAQFFQRQAIQQQMWQDMKVLPSNDLVKKQIILSDNHNVKQLLLQLENAKPMPTEHAMAVIWEAMLKGINRYLAGVFDAQKATEYMQYITEKSLNNEQ